MRKLAMVGLVALAFGSAQIAHAGNGVANTARMASRWGGTPNLPLTPPAGMRALPSAAKAVSSAPRYMQSGVPSVPHKAWSGSGNAAQHSQMRGRWTGGNQHHAGAHGGYVRPARGYFLPRYFVSPYFFVNNWSAYGLAAPMSGLNWVRYYDDAVLVGNDGRIHDSVYGVRWSGSEYGRDEGRYDSRYQDGTLDVYGVDWERYDEGPVPVYVGSEDEYDAGGREYEDGYGSDRGDYGYESRGPRGPAPRVGYGYDEDVYYSTPGSTTVVIQSAPVTTTTTTTTTEFVQTAAPRPVKHVKPRVKKAWKPKAKPKTCICTIR